MNDFNIRAPAQTNTFVKRNQGHYKRNKDNFFIQWKNYDEEEKCM